MTTTAPSSKRPWKRASEPGARWGLSEDAMKKMTIEEFDALPKEKY
ncbi:MAG: hypothetical protein PHC90_13555 [Syntrophorhabdaceae bacterium]|nr:hypothetical protein [Syntrophorhabdaceae bacterium]